MSYTTYETRWFIAGTIPANFETWFKQNCLADSSQPEQRSDIYLYAPNNDFVGIKLRQGRLEIKWRLEELGTMQFGNSVAGKVEKWSKWMCTDSTGEAFLPNQVENSSTWISVNKIRYSQCYQIRFGIVPQQLSNSVNLDKIENHCNVELTLLQSNNNTWWSVALEANFIDSLRATANYLFTNYKNIELLEKDSFAYPSWLGRC
ncbi:hypothetical protein NIES4071_67230 [Calothrix sp. NIES-4071]|nr:hypothetical protein NIES4071_67230 [Calothrix sp. NIES-4071]BAZ61001.1 hypothetical protein NIES4105_67190 [Calothrix sp. NIES-4105]